MSKLTDENRQKAVNEIISVLTDKFKSTYAIQRDAGRSWKFTKEALDKLFEEGKVERLELDNITAWKNG